MNLGNSWIIAIKDLKVIIRKKRFDTLSSFFLS